MKRPNLKGFLNLIESIDKKDETARGLLHILHNMAITAIGINVVMGHDDDPTPEEIQKRKAAYDLLVVSIGWLPSKLAAQVEELLDLDGQFFRQPFYREIPRIG